MQKLLIVEDDPSVRNTMVTVLELEGYAPDAVAVVSDSDEPISPCGACRQVLAEFNADLIVVSATPGGKMARWKLSDLLPKPFFILTPPEGHDLR